LDRRSASFAKANMKKKGHTHSIEFTASGHYCPVISQTAQDF